MFVPQNMVGRGEVDEDLEGETKEECEKYGKVVKCVIFEVSGGDCRARNEFARGSVEQGDHEHSLFCTDCRGAG